MEITINEFILNKIRASKYGSDHVAMILDLTRRPNIPYNRGVLHGYLLSLTTLGIITGDEAISILDQVNR